MDPTPRASTGYFSRSDKSRDREASPKNFVALRPGALIPGADAYDGGHSGDSPAFSSPSPDHRGLFFVASSTLAPRELPMAPDDPSVSASRPAGLRSGLAGILTPEQVTKAPVELVGERAADLARVSSPRLHVPPWLVVPSSLPAAAIRSAGVGARWQEILGGQGESWSEDEERSSPGDRLESLRNLILNLPLSPAFLTELETACHRTFPPGALLAARISGVVSRRPGGRESDSAISIVRGLEELPGIIQHLWARSCDESLLAASPEGELPPAGPEVSVLVQQVVEARVSGVISTVSADTGDRSRLLLEARPGPAAGLLETGLPRDRFTLDRRSGTGSVVTATKVALPVLEEGGFVVRELASGPDSTPCLQSSEIRQLVGLALDVERRLEEPARIEFSLDDEGHLRLHQASRVALSPAAPALRGHRALWDDVPLLEEYPGVIRPLSFSLARSLHVARRDGLARLLGSRRPEEAASREGLGLFHGRVHEDQLDHLRLVEGLPGYSLFETRLEALAGVEDIAAVGKSFEGEPDRGRGQRLRDLARGLPRIPALLWRLSRLEGSARRLEERARPLEAIEEEIENSRPCLTRLRELGEQLERERLRRAGPEGWLDRVLASSMRLLEATARRWLGGVEGVTLVQELLVGAAELPGARVSSRLDRVVLEVAARPDWSRRLLGEPAGTLATKLESGTLDSGLARAVSELVSVIEENLPGELILERPSPGERVESIFKMIQARLRARRSVDVGRGRGLEERRQRAARRIRGCLRAGPAYTLRLRVLELTVELTRTALHEREQARVATVRLHRLLRRLFLEAGGRLHEEGLVESPSDVFFLTAGELWDFVGGQAVSLDLWGLVDLRRREYREYDRQDAPVPGSRFTTWGVPCLGEPHEVPGETGGLEEIVELRGTVVCGGSVTAPVHLADPGGEECPDLDGEILVLERPDCRWLPFFPLARGIVIERGRADSHSALVARELGIPTVVNVPGARARLRQGGHLHLDANRGVLEAMHET